MKRRIPFLALAFFVLLFVIVRQTGPSAKVDVQMCGEGAGLECYIKQAAANYRLAAYVEQTNNPAPVQAPSGNVNGWPVVWLLAGLALIAVVAATAAGDRR